MVWKLALFVIPGPEVSFQHPVVYFSCINLGEYLVQPLEMTNNSDVPAYYQFNIDCKQSVFSFDRPVGVLDGMSTITLKVTFQPTYPIIFYRRVVCLVHHQVRGLEYIFHWNRPVGYVPQSSRGGWMPFHGENRTLSFAWLLCFIRQISLNGNAQANALFSTSLIAFLKHT